MHSVQELQQDIVDSVKELHEYCSQLKSNAKEQLNLSETESEATTLETKQAALHQKGLQLFLGLKENHRFVRSNFFLYQTSNVFLKKNCYHTGTNSTDVTAVFQRFFSIGGTK